MEEKTKGKITAAVFVAAFALAILVIIFAFSALAYELNPGQAKDVYCADCRVDNTTYVNESVGFHCMQGQCANTTCSIQKSLLGGETVMNNNTPCKVNVTCDSTKCGRFQDFQYPAEISVMKTGDQFQTSVSIYNYDGESLKNWTSRFSANSTVDQRDRYNFICPQEVISTVTMQSCANWWDNFTDKGEAIMWPLMQLTTAQTNCTKSLIACQGEIGKIQDQLSECKVNLDKSEDDLKVCVDDKKSCEHELNDGGGSCWKRVDDYTKPVRNEANMWMILAVVFGLITAGLVLNMLFGGEGF